METQLIIPIDLIDPNPYQPRQVEDPAAVAEIAASIKQNGLMQVPSARQVDGRYQLAFGHTRLAAFKFNGEQCIPLIVRDLTDIQMFELGVAENIKRRDLNYVEKAESMKRYMDEFGKNSVETAEFFNTTPEDVRGTVRLNNLPDEAKKKLAGGELTVTTARAILSLQKVAPTKVVAEAIEQLQTGKNEYGMSVTPDEIMEDILEDIDEVQQLYGSGWRNESKPRATSDGWLLDMKNFPNKFLPVLTPVDAAIALGIQDDDAMMEKVACWIEASESNESNLDVIFSIPDELIEKLKHLMKPPACNVCPFYSKVMDNHYCGMKTCFTRKSEAWSREKLRAASKDLGIEIYDAEKDGGFKVLEDTWSDNGKKHLQLFTKRNKDLRLAFAKDIDRKKTQNGYNGVPTGSVVMIVGQTMKKLETDGQKERAEKRSSQQAAQLLNKLLAEKRTALNWEATSHIKVIFDGMSLLALETLWEAPKYGGWHIQDYNISDELRPDDDSTDEVKADFMRRLFCLNMIKGEDWRHAEYEDTVLSYAEWLTETSKGWGVKLPKSISKMAVKMDEEIAAVTAETEE